MPWPDPNPQPKDNMEFLSIESIDGYVPDTQFRKRDPRFADAKRHKPESKPSNKDRLGLKDFAYDPDTLTCICPAGCAMYVKCRNFNSRGHHAVAFQARETDCRSCRLRARCLKDANQKSSRQVHFFTGKRVDGEETYTDRMKQKIDSIKGRYYYSMRLSTVEPVFGQMKWAKQLNRFTLRGKGKVNIQWKLYCMVHNIGKIFRYSPSYG